jgi:hypothetical protein
MISPVPSDEDTELLAVEGEIVRKELSFDVGNLIENGLRIIDWSRWVNNGIDCTCRCFKDFIGCCTICCVEVN